MEILESLDTTHRLFGLVAGTIAIVLYALYRYFLPKPIAGIPYNSSALQSMLGDIPAMTKESNGNLMHWMASQAQRHSSPIIQLFITPFGKPSLVVSDFREAQDILMRRKEFDRSDWSIAMLGGDAPNFHINLKMGAEWKNHRRLLQDLMTPRFLRGVAAPNIYTSVSRLVDLWNAKADIADKRPFSAENDVFFTALDAVLDFGFGNGCPHRALLPQLELLQAKDGQVEQHAYSPAGGAIPIDFPVTRPHESLEAILAASDLIQEVSESGFTKLAWWWKQLQPRERKLRAIRHQFFREQVSHAMEKIHMSDEENESWVKSATELILQRERIFAKKEGRDPLYWSPVTRDEILGFIVAGHDTTSTTFCWGVKLLADSQHSQTRLRQDLWAAHAEARAEKRNPTHDEITKARIPYLDAVIEEILRLAHTAPVLERQCSQDTEILGHHIPKDTVVFFPGLGPSFTAPPFQIDDKLRSETSQMAAKDRGIRAWPVDDIEVFRPDRWLARDNETGAEDYDSTAGPIIAFGLGNRGCYGRKLAYLNLRLMVSLVVWNFELLPCPEELSTYEPIEAITSKPKQCYVRLSKVDI